MEGGFKGWKGVVRVNSEAARDLLRAYFAEGRQCVYRDPCGLEVIADCGGGAVPPCRQWRGFLWVGRRPAARTPRCGARTRKGGACRARCADVRARCRLHGGLSTGPRTPEGRARIAESNRRRGAAKGEAAPT